MDYKKQLEALRAELFSDDPNKAVEVKRKPIVSRVIKFDNLAEKEPDDPLGGAKEWLRKSREAAQMAKSKTGGGIGGGIAQGLSNVMGREQEIEAEARAESRPSIIARPASKTEADDRRSHLPSKYAPRDSKAANFLDLIDKTEGGGDYDTLFGYSNKSKFAGVNVSERTIGELIEFSNPKGEYGQWVKDKVGRVATPMGRYQFVGSTMKAVAKEMGLSMDTVFDKETQDAMFAHYLKKRINSAETMSGKIEAIRSGWEGFRSVDSGTLADLINKYEG